MTTVPTVPRSPGWTEVEREAMDRAMQLAGSVRRDTSPNPWVGAVLVGADGTVAGVGATEPAGGAHAEVGALRQAGERARGATLVVTLEPCSHHGRTPPCTDAIIAAGVRRVVVATLDPDRRVSGTGVRALGAAGIDVQVGLRAGDVEEQLAPYLKHRRCGRPWVVLKLAATLDGRIAAPDGTSAWITGPEARADAHELRAASDAVLVGAGTVRADDPRLTVRSAAGADAERQPLRVVLGEAGPGARVQPALAMGGALPDVLDELGRRQVLQVLVEGGARVARAFHCAGLVDRYVVYLAPALFGGDDAVPMFAGPGVPTIGDLWRGQLVALRRIGDDLRVDLAPPVRAPSVAVAAGGPDPEGA